MRTERRASNGKRGRILSANLEFQTSIWITIHSSLHSVNRVFRTAQDSAVLSIPH